MSAATQDLKQSVEKITAELADQPARRLIGVGVVAGVVGIIGVVAFIATVLDSPAAAVDLEEMSIAIASGVCAILGGILYVAGLIVRYNRLGQERIIHGQERILACQLHVLAALNGVDPETIGRFAAQMSTIEQAVPAVRAAVELDRQVVLQRIDDVERQRQADLTQMRENGAKLFESVLERLDVIEGRLDDAFVDSLSAQEESGGKVTRLVRPRPHGQDWPKRS